MDPDDEVALRDDQCEIVGVAGVSRDITERKRLAEGMECRGALLHAVSAAARELLTAPTVEIAMAIVLATIGVAARVDRMIVFEN